MGHYLNIAYTKVSRFDIYFCERHPGRGGGFDLYGKKDHELFFITEKLISGAADPQTKSRRSL